MLNHETQLFNLIFHKVISKKGENPLKFKLCLVYIYSDKIMEDEMGEEWNTHWKDEKCI